MPKFIINLLNSQIKVYREWKLLELPIYQRLWNCRDLAKVSQVIKKPVERDQRESKLRNRMMNSFQWKVLRKRWKIKLAMDLHIQRFHPHTAMFQVGKHPARLTNIFLNQNDCKSCRKRLRVKQKKIHLWTWQKRLHVGQWKYGDIQKSKMKLV